MIRKNLLKATLITTVIATLLIQVGCGNKSANNTADTKSTISSETKSNAAKELTKTSLVTFDYTDEEGNTYTLEGKAVATESGDATIEVTDAKGNKVTFTGKATTVDGKMSVSNVAVKDEGILVKADGTEIKIGVGSTVADANENTDSNAKSDIVASDDVKKEIETAKQEEDVIIAAREEVTGVDVNNNDSSDIFDSAIEETMTEYIIQEPSIYDVTYAPIEPSTENKTEEINGEDKKEENIGAQEKTQEEQDIENIKATTTWIKPIEGTITSKFGQREPTTSTVPKNHTGTDIGANIGAKIKASTSGEVVLASEEGDYGKHLKIQIGEVSIIYAHCNALYVKQGDHIEQGQEIAEVGSTGNSTRTTFAF